MKIGITYLAWISLVVAFCAWGAVVYIAFSLQDQAASNANSTAQSEQQLDRIAYAQRLAALASDTKDERTRLESIVQPDIVAIVNVIEAAGKSVKVNATVSDALSEGGPQALPGGQSLQTVAFVVQAQGSFASLMQLAALFEHLPLSSSVEQLELEHTPSADTKVAPWHLAARIRVMTTSISI